MEHDPNLVQEVTLVKDIFALDATAQSALIRSKAISPLELMQKTIDRIIAVNPHINAIIYPLFDSALAQARQWTRSGPSTDESDPLPLFWGVPFLIKDLTDLSGIPTGYGSRFAALAYERGAPYPTDDDPIVTRFRQAGLIVVGKSNTPELGLLPTTEPEHYGPTKNPWDRTRTVGGSSGGAAAAVAAGLVPIAHASDAGGSIRIPASCCGLFGFKPSRHPLITTGPRDRVTGAPQKGSIDLFTEHVITRSVRDSAAMYDWLHGTTPGKMPETTLKKHNPPRPGTPLRIGYSTITPSGQSVHPHCRDAVIGAAKLLSELGHHVESAAPQMDGTTMTQAFMTIWAHECASSVQDLARRLQMPLSRDLDGFEPVTRALVTQAAKLTATDLESAEAVLFAARAAMVRYFETYDLWLTPTLATPPVPLGTFTYDANVFDRTNAFSPFTPIANVAGLPAMSLPLALKDQLPIGVQCVGRPGDDKTLLALAFQVEEAMPWTFMSLPS